MRGSCLNHALAAPGCVPIFLRCPGKEHDIVCMHMRTDLFWCLGLCTVQKPRHQNPYSPFKVASMRAGTTFWSSCHTNVCMPSMPWHRAHHQRAVQSSAGGHQTADTQKCNAAHHPRPDRGKMCSYINVLARLALQAGLAKRQMTISMSMHILCILMALKAQLRLPELQRLSKCIIGSSSVCL